MTSPAPNSNSADPQPQTTQASAAGLNVEFADLELESSAFHGHAEKRTHLAKGRSLTVEAA